MDELEIRALGLNEKKNKVVVYFQDKLNEESIQKINSMIDPETVEYDVDKTQIMTTANIINGTQSVIGSEGLTVGFAAVNSSGTKGFVTAGHLSAGVGSTAKINGNTVGTLRNKTFGGGVDAAWVEATGSYVPTKTFSNGDTYSSAATDTSNTNLVQGKTVYAYGSVSGKQTGQILEAYYTVTYNGATMVDTVKASYKAIHGDSGAAVCYYRYVGSASSFYSVMGIQSASALVNDAWVSGTSYTIFTRTDKIFTTLNLSNP
ncbi:Alpha-lytic protease precursor [compost metagenome]